LSSKKRNPGTCAKSDSIISLLFSSCDYHKEFNKCNIFISIKNNPILAIKVKPRTKERDDLITRSSEPTIEFNLDRIQLPLVLDVAEQDTITTGKEWG